MGGGNSITSSYSQREHGMYKEQKGQLGRKQRRCMWRISRVKSRALEDTLELCSLFLKPWKVNEVFKTEDSVLKHIFNGSFYLQCGEQIIT